MASSKSIRDELLKEHYAQKALALFDQVSLALVGIGSVEPSKLLASSGNVFSKEELDMLRDADAVGDICLRFFNIEGKPITTALDERVVSISLRQLKSAKRSVGVAGGTRKTDGIRGALQGEWINVLITDQRTAQRLLA